MRSRKVVPERRNPRSWEEPACCRLHAPEATGIPARLPVACSGSLTRVSRPFRKPLTFASESGTLAGTFSSVTAHLNMRATAFIRQLTYSRERFAVLDVVRPGEVIVLHGQSGDSPVLFGANRNGWDTPVTVRLRVFGQDSLVLLTTFRRVMWAEVDVSIAAAHPDSDAGVSSGLVVEIRRDGLLRARHECGSFRISW